MARKFICTPSFPIVNTKQGRLRGYQVDDVYTFLGVGYAKAERFRPPQEPDAWEGIKDAHSYGYVCPLMSQSEPGIDLIMPRRFWLMDEHCQNLNIWTTSLDKDAKKPVMVWLHGGGFTTGSAIELMAYEGDHLSSYVDVVVVTINHRLNILGYMDLSAYGEKYKNSANAGNADIVAALKWIHENIEAFGGNPENVTLFGESGGGEKVICMLNTPEADGLFHKGIIQSGVTDLYWDAEENGQELIALMLDEAGLDEKDVEALEEMPYTQLVSIYRSVVKQMIDKGGYIGCGPVKNDWYLGNPKTHGFSDHAKKIPLLVGTVLGELHYEPGVQNKYTLSESEMLKLLVQEYGEDTERLVSLFKMAYPNKNLTDLLYVDYFIRRFTSQFIEQHVRECEAPVYSYLFAYDLPLDGGKVAVHTAEIPFVFHNTDRSPLYNVEGETDRIEEQFCSAFVNFAKYGKPSAMYMPDWPACTVETENTMIIDKTCEIRSNYDQELIKKLTECDKGSWISLAQFVL